MNKLHIKFLIIATALFCLPVVPSLMATEPSYNGKPLSEWLLILKIGQTSTGERVETPVAEEAIRQMGTNAIPTLLDILGATSGNKERVLGRAKSKGFRDMFHNKNVPLDDLRDTAVQGFGILGTNAVSAIPQINKLFRDWETCSPAAQALAELGSEGCAALTNGLHNPNADIRGVTIWAIGEKSSIDSNTITRLMISCLNDPQNREDAARYLGGKDPAVAIPALIPLLDEDTNFPVIEGASRALSSYGAAAEVTIPKLLSIYTNAVVQKDRQAARSWGIMLMSAMKSIDKNAAAKAEAFIVNGGPLGVAGYGWTTTKLSNGRELIAGGCFESHVFSRAQLFDPITGQRTEIDSMNVARCGHMAVLLSDGKVLVAGGSDLVANRVHDLSSAEIYDPITGKWVETGSMNSQHPSERAALQSNGKVLVYEGGFDKYPIHGHELYDPATGTWTVVTNK